MTMRPTERQLREILERSEKVKKRREQEKRLAVDAVSTFLCLSLLIAACMWLPNLADAAPQTFSESYGSLILGSACLGHVVIGVLAFALGVCVTLLCLHWRGLKRGEDGSR